MTAFELLRGILARIVAAREEYDASVRDQILVDLEHDVAGWLAEWEEHPA